MIDTVKPLKVDAVQKKLVSKLNKQSSKKITDQRKGQLNTI